MQYERLDSPPVIEMPTEHSHQKTSRSTSIDFVVLLTNAEKLIQHREKDLARGLIYKALAMDSQHPSALRLAERILHPVEDLEKILKIRESLYQTDYCFETIASLAECLYKLNQDSLAKEKYREAITLPASSIEKVFEVYKNLGNILTKEGDYDGAEEYYHRAFALNPNSDVLLVNLGTLELQQNEYNEALERFRKAIQLNKKNDKAWVGLALVHNQMGDRALAIANIENAIDLNPSNRTAVHIYSNWLAQEGKYLQATEILQNYISECECDEDLSLVLVQVFCQINRFDLAALEAERVLLWNPQSEKMQQIEKELRKMNQGAA